MAVEQLPRKLGYDVVINLINPCPVETGMSTYGSVIFDGVVGITAKLD